MKDSGKRRAAAVLDPISRISEIIFGVLMALSFTGSLNAATAGREEVRTMMLTALGCNLAWGLVDAVMYLMATLTGRARNLTLLGLVRGASDPQTAHDAIAEVLPGRLGEAIGHEGLEEMRRRLTALTDVPARARLGKDDFLGAFGVFLLVVLSTFPVVVPFIFISEMALAMRVSNGVALVLLFIGGYRLGHYAGGVAWKTGFTMAAVGGRPGVDHHGARRIGMRAGLSITVIAAAALLLGAKTCLGQVSGLTTAPSSTADATGWSYSVTGMYYSFRDQDDFTLAVATADRGPLHIEARYNYEAIDSGSLFAGWKFSGGEKLTWEVTPILGAVFGQKEGIAPGVEASIGFGIVDFYTESEYVRDIEVRGDSFIYSWNELGLSPWEWLRFGLVTQRTMVYQSDRDIQRGFFAEVLYRRVTVAAYVFNPDDSDNRFMVFSLGAEF